MEKFTLSRTNQCNKCPWKVTTNPFDIPNGYDVAKHQNLACTIASEGNLAPNKAMACHESKEGQEDYCIGWLHNQLGRGNNIPLRIKMIRCTNAADIRIHGEQHLTFEDTLPK